MNTGLMHRFSSWGAIALAAALAMGTASRGFAQMSASIPFTDLADCGGFVDPIAEAYLTGLTNGTSATTFSPTGLVNREQMAAFVTRTLDSSVSRTIVRASLGQWAVPKSILQMATTSLGGVLMNTVSDGPDVWVADSSGGRVLKIQGSTGRLLETWTGATGAFSMVSAMGKIFVISNSGALYQIDPQNAPGAVTVISTTAPLLAGPTSILFDGSQLWVIGYSGVSLVHPRSGPWSVTTYTDGFSALTGAIFDGNHVWVTDFNAGTLLELNEYANVIRTVAVGKNPMYPVFNGTNIFVPCFSDDSVAVVHVSSGALMTTITGNGLSGPESAAFDGDKILVTNFSGDSVSVWKSTTLAPLGAIDMGTDSFPTFVSSNGVNFFITLQSGTLARF
ncbi:MAG TPA: S-layer homology domain-containing protein [Thermoanaerobaculia bacterium]|nr:S-layer homology domain-containing protein [Thermoanaerobaculia bacterium]